MQFPAGSQKFLVFFSKKNVPLTLILNRLLIQVILASANLFCVQYVNITVAMLFYNIYSLI